ncbi:GNAT family N-acetyltransferase [Neobacillus sp. 114]|uniref:GNAT family N-acetyltransferase n=1 Tax=Neobacillus sp. 114 TaxID=3048535 RepID=UPI0024C3D667|nr:GNAT family N-acetyltransferase [Neobacillus sp. 114]
MESKTKNNLVQLVKYTDRYEPFISNFYLPPEKLQFTCYPLEKINNPTTSQDTIHVLILVKDIPVGFFALETGEKVLKYTKNLNARLLTAFSINNDLQGKGFAKQGLLLLPRFVNNNFQNVNEVVLGVNKRNTAAINLYKKTGFVDHNEIFLGPNGEQHIMHLYISREGLV